MINSIFSSFIYFEKVLIITVYKQVCSFGSPIALSPTVRVGHVVSKSDPQTPSPRMTAVRAP